MLSKSNNVNEEYQADMLREENFRESAKICFRSYFAGGKKVGNCREKPPSLKGLVNYIIKLIDY
jgi:hypothetical protein